VGSKQVVRGEGLQRRGRRARVRARERLEGEGEGDARWEMLEA
jgi:hypothetical protein